MPSRATNKYYVLSMIYCIYIPHGKVYHRVDFSLMASIAMMEKLVGDESVVTHHPNSFVASYPIPKRMDKGRCDVCWV